MTAGIDLDRTGRCRCEIRMDEPQRPGGGAASAAVENPTIGKQQEDHENLVANLGLLSNDKETDMPTLTVEGVGTIEVSQGKRLVLALVDEGKIDQLHACGGNARCTTCRVEFVAGEPDLMTASEKSVLAARGLTGIRLSCQILCDHDMTVRAISRFAGSGRKDAGKRPDDAIQPQPVEWAPK